MKSTLIPLSLIVVFSVWACGPSTNQTSTPEPQARVDALHAAPLGTEVAADHFTVTLNSAGSELSVGDAKFIVTLTHHGSAASEANVVLRLSMPSMNMGGPTITMKPLGSGRYEGSANLSMGGDWQAIVDVEDHGHRGSATYSFVVMQ